MKLVLRLALVTVVAAGGVLVASPAGATECTPKGCSGGCHLNPDALDPRAPGQIIVCYS